MEAAPQSRLGVAVRVQSPVGAVIDKRLAAHGVAETAVVVGVLHVVTSLAVRLDLVWRFDALVPLVFLVTGGTGLALVLAGLTLVWKRVELLNDLVLLFVMFFSGAALAVDELPSWADPISQSLFLTHAVAALRTVMLDGNALDLWGVGGVVWLTGTAAAWFAAGLLAFRTFERMAKRDGSLARY